VSARIVAVQKVDPVMSECIFDTDVRSSKVTEIARSPGSCLVRYDPAARVQIRLFGFSVIHNKDALAKQIWSATSPRRRRFFASGFAPGTRYLSGLGHRSKDGFEQFAVIRTTVDRMDLLRFDKKRWRRWLVTRQGGGWQVIEVAP
jgi:hypothetical protein